jgi:nucleoside-diphosphate-sugar epimerase
VTVAHDGAPVARDGCVVATEPLSAMLGAFVSQWSRDRPSTRGRFSARRERTDVSPVGAVAWLAAETNLPAGTIENVVSGRVKTTELRIADALVTAIGREDTLSDGEFPRNAGGTLEIMPNPLARPADRARCCAGSGDAALERICARYSGAGSASSAPPSLTGSGARA